MEGLCRRAPKSSTDRPPFLDATPPAQPSRSRQSFAPQKNPPADRNLEEPSRKLPRHPRTPRSVTQHLQCLRLRSHILASPTPHLYWHREPLPGQTSSQRAESSPTHRQLFP